MASLLRQIVAGPRAKHAETGLDLCYVTSNIIATSGPSNTYPQRAYRNPLDQLVAFLDSRHGDNWSIWEFRAEGTGYPDELVYNRIRHYPWPDHHPPPFRLVPLILASMRQWLEGGGPTSKPGGGDDPKNKRVVVVHCKAGKGRSGTMACSYLIAECGWTMQAALDRFTERRMRPRFGGGVTIPSQLRWVGYVDRWTKAGGREKIPYADRPVEILEIHIWGLRHGVKLSVEGYVDEGKKIQVFHTFKNDERFVVEGDAPGGGGLIDMMSDMAGNFSPRVESPRSPDEVENAAKKNGDGDDPEPDEKGGKIARPKTEGPVGASISSSNDLSTPDSTKLASGASLDINQLKSKSESTPALVASSTTPIAPVSGKMQTKRNAQPFKFASSDEPGGRAVLFRPKTPIRVPGSDVNVVIERRNKTAAGVLGGLTMVTSVAHVWFNVFFEGNGPEQGGKPDDTGVFAIDWDKLDGIKGSSQKGSRAAERIAVVWRAIKEEEEEKEEEIKETKATEAEGKKAAETAAVPASTESIPQMRPADWKGDNREDPEAHKHLGLRKDDPASAGVSRASSVKSLPLAGSDGNGNGDSKSSGVQDTGSDDEVLATVKTSGPEGEDLHSSS